MITTTVCILGYFGIGKTSLIKKFLYRETDKNVESTIGASIFSKLVKNKNKKFSIHTTFWDTAGQEQYAPLIPMYTRSADVLLCAIEPSIEKSVSYIENNIESIISSRIKNPPLVLFIVATKIDIEENNKLAPTISKTLMASIQKLIQKYNLENKIHIGFYLSSSLSDYNIDPIFHDSLEYVYNNKTKHYQKRETIILEENEKSIEERNINCCKIY